MTDLLWALGARVATHVEFGAIVESAAHVFTGTHTHARHETFRVRTDAGPSLDIVDNIDIAPPVPVVPGDRISVGGDLVFDRSGAAIVHWTHHDPAGRHPGGWIDAGGRRYA